MILESGPLYNSILLYILFVTVIILVKPKQLYCNKTKKFKTFGCGNKQTLLSFPIVCLISIVIFYFFFLMLEIINNYLD